MSLTSTSRGQRRSLQAALAASALCSLGLTADARAQTPGSSDAASARAQEIKAVCALAYVDTQSLRQAGDLVGARAKALQCAESSCPPVTTKDCTQWLGELDASLPSVVFRVRDEAGRDLTDVQISMDGQKLAERADGAELSLNPGRHAFRFEVAGKRVLSQEAVLSVGEKRRTIEATFEVDKPRPPSTPPPPPAPPPERRPHLTAAAATFGVLGVVGVGAFVTFGAIGLRERNQLRDTCQPRCTDDDVAGVRWKLTTADVSLGVGAASLVVAGALFLRGAVPEPKRARSALRVDLAPMKGGGFLGVASAF